MIYVPKLIDFHYYHVPIKTLVTNYLQNCYRDVNHSHNLSVSQILCLKKTIVHHLSTGVPEFINIHDFLFMIIMY